jgi:hypothetical protein
MRGPEFQQATRLSKYIHTKNGLFYASFWIVNAFRGLVALRADRIDNTDVGIEHSILRMYFERAVGCWNHGPRMSCKTFAVRIKNTFQPRWAMFGAEGLCQRRKKLGL